MPQADHIGHRRSLPGVYAWLLDKATHSADGVDPRALIGGGGGGVDCRPRHLKTYLPLLALESGEPAVIPAWLLGGHSWPEARGWPEYRDRSVTGWVVRADDRVDSVRGPSPFYSP